MKARRHLYLLLTIIIVLTLLSNCAHTNKIKTGDQAFEGKRYMLATDLYKREIDKTPGKEKKAPIAFRIGESYRFANKPDNAEIWYKEAVQYGYGSKAIYYYAESLKKNEKYQAAIKQYNKYLKSNPHNEKAKRALEGCQQALKWKETKTNFQVASIKNINSEKSDYSPTFYQNEYVVFASERPSSLGESVFQWTGEKYADIYIAAINKQGKLKQVETFDDNFIINTFSHEGSSCFNKQGNIIYFTRCGSKGENDDFCKIYQSQKNETGVWSEPKPLLLFEDSVNVGHPSISPNGKLLYYTSDAPGGQGGKDIYYAQKTRTGWSYPVNLGPDINTNGNEMFPYIYNDSILFFSSDGHIGAGGLDIYMAVKRGRKWKVKNLMFPVNSGADDFGLVLQNQKKFNKNGYNEVLGLFTSTREGGKGSDDIYHLLLHNPSVYLLQITVKEKIFNDPDDPNSAIAGYKVLPEARVDLMNMNNQILDTARTDDSGKIIFQLEPFSINKTIASKTNYFNASKTVRVPLLKEIAIVTDTIKVELVLDKIFKKKEIVIPNIYYDYNEASIREDAFEGLDMLVDLLIENPAIKVELGSHTDSRGSSSYNQQLSQKRAESCVKYLVSKEIESTRLLAKGYGESRLVNHCKNGVDCSEEEHQRNRRTTFKVIGIDMSIESVEPEMIITDYAPGKETAKQQKKKQIKKIKDDEKFIKEENLFFEDKKYIEPEKKKNKKKRKPKQ